MNLDQNVNSVQGADSGQGWFPQHPKSGPWETLKGKMLTPQELPYMTSQNYMNQRPGSQSSIQQEWNSTVIVNTGETGGGGAMAK